MWYTAFFIQYTVVAYGLVPIKCCQLLCIIGRCYLREILSNDLSMLKYFCMVAHLKN